MTVKTQRIFFASIGVVMLALVVSINNTDTILERASAFLFPQNSSVSSVQNSSSSSILSSMQSSESSQISSSEQSSNSSEDICAGKSICYPFTPSDPIRNTGNGYPSKCPEGCYAVPNLGLPDPCYNSDDPGELTTDASGVEGYNTVGWRSDCESFENKICCQTTATTTETSSDGEETTTLHASWHFMTNADFCSGPNNIIVNTVCCVEESYGIPDEQNSCT